MTRSASQPATKNAASRVRKNLERLIKSGQAGAALPSVRELMTELGVSPVTVSRALAELQREGLIVARPGAGTYIAERRARNVQSSLDWQSVTLGASSGASDLELLVDDVPARALSLSSGYMDLTLQPADELSRAARRVLREPDAWARAPLDGIAGLRAWFASRAGGGVEARDVLLVHGGQGALSTALRAVAAPGTSVLVESPTYIGALAAARAALLKPVPVPVDAHGMRPELLAEAFRTTGARVLYLQPCFSNPTGVSLSSERKAEILAIAEQNAAFVIEDDYCRDLAHRDPPPPALVASDQHGHVIYISSLTKSVAPSMRVAALIAKGPVVSRLRAARVVEDFFLPRPLQAIALEFVTSPAYAKHLRTLRSALRERMQILVACLKQHLPAARVYAVPEGGFSLWLGLPDGVDEAAFVRQAREASVIVSPGKHWFPAEPTGPFLRLSIAGATGNELEEGVARLGKLVPKR
jgi:DNA-binding transcriptional MocR family regulator